MFPPPPALHIDWAKLGLAMDIKVHGHIEVRYHASKTAWTAPQLVADNNIAVSGLSPGLNYGQQCYEGMKALRHATPAGVDKLTVFRPAFHAARMARSAASVCLPPPPEALFLECVRAAVAANAEFVPPAGGDGFLYIRPVLFGASTQLALMPPEEVVFAVFVHPSRPYHGADALDAVVLEEFDRAAPRGMGAFKVGGNYAPVWRHAAKARGMGYGITLHLDSATRTNVEEFSTSGFLGLREEAGEVVLAVPQTGNAIASATADALVRVAELQGWRVEHKELAFDCLPSLSEVVAVGTAAAAVPIRSIARLSTDDKFTFAGTSGAEGVESRLLGLARIMSEMQRGQREDTEGWCWEVTASEDELAASGEKEEESAPSLPAQNLSTLGRLVSSLHPATLLGLWAFFVSPVPAIALGQMMK